MDEPLRIYRDSTIPVREAQRELAGVYVLSDRSTGRFTAIARWETEAAAEATPPSGYINVVTGGTAVQESFDISVEDLP